MKTKGHLVQIGLLCAAMLPAAVKAQFNFTTNNGELTITGYTGPGGAVVIPATTNSLPVVTIGSTAFQNRTTVTSITIPNSVTNIGNQTFYGCGLTSLTIPDSVISVGLQAFYGCTALTNVTIGGGALNLGTAPFQNCSRLIAITVNPTNLLYSSTNGVLFKQNKTILVEYPAGRAGAYTIPGTVTSIKEFSFYRSTNLTSVTMPNSVRGIEQCAFLGCSGLTNLTISTNVFGIAYEAFFGCSSLTSVTIPITVNGIGEEAFAGCSSLTAMMVDSNNSWYSSLDGVLFNKDQTTLVQFPGGVGGNYIIPNSVASIRNRAFEFCKKLTSVVIPDSVNSIGIDAFFSCSGLTNVTIGSNVVSIGGSAFSFCTGLTSVTIPDSVTSLGSIAFEWCTALTSVTIGSNVTSIGWYTFYYCASLNSVYFRGNAPSLDPEAFANDSNVTVYYLPWTTGWGTPGTPFGGFPTVLWLPQVQTGDASFGVVSNQFGFNITWASDLVVVVEACTNLADPAWTPVGTNTLTGGSSYFSDSQWTNYPGRFYRLRWP